MGKLNVEPRTIFCHDNLEVLQGINSDCIDLIYLDPPFNKKKTFTAPIGSSAEGAEFSDIFREKDVKDEWVDSIRFENPELHEYLNGVNSFSNKYNYCYLAYMSIRLLECHRILRGGISNKSGSIYLHCDPTMSHYLKIVLDCIFGENNFRNEIVWCYTRMSAKGQKKLSSAHDVIFYYTKNKNYCFNVDDIRLPYAEGSRKREGQTLNRLGSGYSKEGKTVLNSKGKFPEDWITHIPYLRGKERTGYPTQKPLALLERIVNCSSNPGDLVLDPFCGCATTCVAAEKLGRKWIGIDVSHKAYDLVQSRLKKEAPKDIFLEVPNYYTDPPKRTDLGKSYLEHGNVYIISNKNWGGMYKVGIAKDVKRRLNSYQTSDPLRAFKLEYSIETPYYKEVEDQVHEKYDGDRLNEWVQGDLAEIKTTIKEEVARYGT